MVGSSSAQKDLSHSVDSKLMVGLQCFWQHKTRQHLGFCKEERRLPERLRSVQPWRFGKQD